MLSRAVFILLALFWLTMNGLLWRAEYGARPSAADAVPAELVWQKVLTSPDSSSLRIIHHGRNIGFCHWITSVGEEWAEVTEANMTAGASDKPRAYRLRLEGSVMTGPTNRLRFDATLKTDRFRVWQELDARLSLPPVSWQIHASAGDQTVRLKIQDGEGRVEKVLELSDLRSPGAVVEKLMGPLAGPLLGETAWPVISPGALPPSPGIQWEAHEDTIEIRRAQMRVYRLNTRLLEQYQITFMVSRVGEILRVELPDELVWVNDQLTVL